MGTQLKVTRDRGQFFETPLAEWLTVTIHPSAILRMPDEDARREARAQFIADLKKVAARLRAG